MKHQIALLMAMIILPLTGFCTSPQDSDRYTLVEAKIIKATPEEYKNKRIRIETVYLGFLPVFPQYAEKSGFRADKYYCLRILPATLPVMLEKKQDIAEQIPSLKKGRKIVVYGKIKKFRINSKFGLPSYYLELEEMDISEEIAELPDEEKEAIKKHPRHPFRRKL